MTAISKVLGSYSFPEIVEEAVIGFAKPHKLSNCLTDEIKHYGTYSVIQLLRQKCETGWKTYCEEWNNFETSGIDPLPPTTIWDLIMEHVQNWNKADIEEMKHTVQEIMANPKIQKKEVGKKVEKMEYQSNTQKYKLVEKNYTKFDFDADLTAIIHGLDDFIRSTEIQEAQSAFRAQFESEEDFENYLIDQENEQFLEQISTTEGYYEWRYS